MLRYLARVTGPCALVLVVYACGGGGGADGDPGGGEAGSGPEGSTSDGPSGSDGPTTDSPPGTDAAPDGSTDAPLDAADAADAEPPGPPAVRYIGRFDFTAPTAPKVGFPSSEIVARFSGTEVSATFSDALVYDDTGPTRWEAVVDGVSTVLSISRAQATYPLAAGLAPGKHTVRLVKLTEASVGISQFMGFDFNGGTLLAPPIARTRHLEFLGDSASNGYGIEGNIPCGFTAATENAEKSYPALVAKDLAADHHNLATSGKGILQNYYRPDTEVYSIIYQRTLPFTGGSTFDFTEYTPDVVWMTLGGNDYSEGSDANGTPDTLPPLFASFETKYSEMVTLIRTKRPDAHIFCTVAPSLTNAFPANFNAYTNVKTAADNVVTAKKNAGDNKIHFFEFTRSLPADLTACQGHPNVAKHRAMADEAIAIIKTKTGW